MLSLILGLGLLLSVALPGHAGSLGDANCNGVVNVSDAYWILAAHAGLAEEVPCPTLADVDGDGRIGAIDALLILQLDAGLIDAL